MSEFESELVKTVSKKKIKKAVKNIANEINADYGGEKIVLVGILKGAFVFLADLMRKIKVPCEVDFIIVKSYGNSAETSGTVNIVKDLDIDIKGRHVIIVEDIIDTGLTLSEIVKMLAERSPATLKTAALFDKPSKRKITYDTDYTGIKINDFFAVGYGLDFAEKYRNLPSLYEIKRKNNGI
jgi:hypoxanthine phosphoribosyltransferase